MIPPLDVLRRFAAHDFSLDGFFAARLQRLAEQVVVEAEGACLSWSQFAEQADRAVAWLQEQGIREGDRVGLMAYNHPATPMLLLACARVGAILVPCNPDVSADDARYIFEHAGVAGVLCSEPALQRVQQALAARNERPAPPPWVTVLRTPEPTAPSPPCAPLMPWSTTRPDAHTRCGTADHTLFILYTSGTTGFPKGVMHSQRTYVLTAEAFVQRLYLQPSERVLCVLPLFHINALMYSLGGTLACGGTLILVPRFSASTFWRTVADTRATEVNVIMSAAAILARRPPEEFVPDHQLRKMFIAPLNRSLQEAFTGRFGVPTLIECYGMTEIPGVLANPFLGPHKLGTMGVLSVHPDPAIERPRVRLIDDAGCDVAPGEVGQLVVRTPTLMQGYWRDPAQTAAAFRDGWFLTGDLARQDADGYYVFHARQKDIIRRRGENLSGAEIDTAIASHPDVQECATIGVPSVLGEEEVLCAVVPRAGTALTPQAVHAHACQRLAPLKRPRYVVLVDSLPHTGSMKIAKFRLQPADELLRRATDFQAEPHPAPQPQTLEDRAP
ncbi:MAG: long-chain-fatty-acid--CoA ligase LcfB [Pseudomonadota bacterium]